MPKPFLDQPGPIAFAHRGGASDAPENTLSAFQYAVDQGYTYVETDVHATNDGVLIAFHDDRLDRVTDRAGIINELSWAEVREARVDGTEPIPLFEDLLTTWPEMRINVDPKADSAVEPLIEVIRRTDSADRLCVGAFSDRRIDRVRDAIGGDLCTGMGPRQVAKLAATATGVPFVGRFRSDCAQVPIKQGPIPLVTQRFVDAAHDHDVAVHVWTIDEPDEMRRLLDLGVDGIMTDRPTVLRDVFTERGLWPTR